MTNMIQQAKDQVLELTLETAEFDECTDGFVSGKGIGER